MPAFDPNLNANEATRFQLTSPGFLEKPFLNTLSDDEPGSGDKVPCFQQTGVEIGILVPLQASVVETSPLQKHQVFRAGAASC